MNEKEVSILLVEDEEEILKLNKKALEQRGFHVLCASTLSRARSLLQQYTVQLIVLDVLLPDGSGLDFCADLREGSTVPILILSCLNSKNQIVDGLLFGSDDYLTKPYRMEEFLARIHSLLRREAFHQKQMQCKLSERILACGPLRLDVSAAKAYLKEQDLGLTPKEFALLLLLVQKEGLIVSMQEISEVLWGIPEGNDMRAVWTHISHLRNKLCITQDSQLNITVQRGKGYILTCHL